MEHLHTNIPRFFKLHFVLQSNGHSVMIPQSISVETDFSSSSSETSPTDSCSPSLKTDESPSPSPPLRSKKAVALSIDSAIDLRPIMDSPISKKQRQNQLRRSHRKTNRKSKRESDRKSKRDSNGKSTRKSKPRSRCKSKSKSPKRSPRSPKRPHGFTKLLSLFTANVKVEEESMKKLCHRQITEILSIGSDESDDIESRHFGIIRNIEVSDKERVCDLTERIFHEIDGQYDEHGLQLSEPSLKCRELWNFGLMMLFMVSGRRRICRNWKYLVDMESIHMFLCGLFLEEKISTNLFDLLSFYMLIVDGKGMDTVSRYRQITSHRWFHK